MIHTKVADIIREHTPNVVVLERFNLYPGMAKHLSWNSFYPCEVIGVIKYVSATFGIKVIEQAPGVKKFSGGLQEDWEELKKRSTGMVTEHTKDAYLHYKYYIRNKK